MVLPQALVGLALVAALVGLDVGGLIRLGVLLGGLLDRGHVGVVVVVVMLLVVTSAATKPCIMLMGRALGGLRKTRTEDAVIHVVDRVHLTPVVVATVGRQLVVVDEMLGGILMTH